MSTGVTRGRFHIKVGIIVVLVILFFGFALGRKWDWDKERCNQWYDMVALGIPLENACRILKAQGANVVTLDNSTVKAYPIGPQACYVYMEARTNRVTHVSIRSSDRFDEIWKRKE